MHLTCAANAPHKYGQILEQYSADRLSKIKPDDIDSLYIWHPSQHKLVEVNPDFFIPTIFHSTAPQRYGQCTKHAESVKNTMAIVYIKLDQIINPVPFPTKPLKIKPNLSTLYLSNIAKYCTPQVRPMHPQARPVHPTSMAKLSNNTVLIDDIKLNRMI